MQQDDTGDLCRKLTILVIMRRGGGRFSISSTSMMVSCCGGEPGWLMAASLSTAMVKTLSLFVSLSVSDSNARTFSIN